MANKIVRKSKCSAEYWRQREAENLKKYLLSEEEYVKRVHEILDYTADQIQREINGFYSKYADKEGISIADAKRRIKEADVEAFARKAKRYVKEKNFSKQANDEMRLYNATMKINRLELLKANIGLELVAGFDELQKYDEEILTERTREELERQAGILGNTIQNNEKMVSSIVNASFHHATYSDRIWMYQAMMKTELDKLLRQGLIQGKNPRQLASHLQKLFGVSKYNAERLMRTELARVQIDAQKQSYERNNFEQYTFLALGTACEACLVLDGKHFNVKDMMPGENAPPIHPNCRCATSAYVDESSYNEWLDTYQKHGLSFEEWKQRNLVAKDRENGIIKSRNISERRMANGLRTSPYHILSDEEIKSVKKAAKELNIPESILRFNQGNQTGFWDGKEIINIRGDILPDKSSNNLRDVLSSKAVLAHEYYGYYKNHPSQFRVGDWRDEFRASYCAALNAPNLSAEERRMLMLDAYDRAKEAGVRVRYNKEARRLIYGYDE